jgi:hypothetical protein
MPPKVSRETGSIVVSRARAPMTERAGAIPACCKANKFARGKREVLIIGRIPPDAIVEVKDHRASSCT